MGPWYEWYGKFYCLRCFSRKEIAKTIPDRATCFSSADEAAAFLGRRWYSSEQKWWLIFDEDGFFRCWWSSSNATYCIIFASFCEPWGVMEHMYSPGYPFYGEREERRAGRDGWIARSSLQIIYKQKQQQQWWCLRYRDARRVRKTLP